jgi:hypothetical protein
MAKRSLGVVIVASAHTKKTGVETNRFLAQVKDDTTILKYQIQVLKNVFKTPDITVVTGFGHDGVYNELRGKVSVVENDLWETTSVVRSLSLGMRTLTNHKILLIPSCLVFRSGALKGVDYHDNGLIVTNPKTIQPTELGLLTEPSVENKVLRTRYVDYDFSTKWSQLAFFSGKTLEAFRGLCDLEEFQRHLFHELINMMLNDKHELTPVFNRRSSVYDINTSKDIELIRRTKYASIV